MRSIQFPVGGPPTVAQAPDPRPGPGQLLVRTEVVGAGIGLVRMLANADEPVSPGAEVVGTVVDVGDEASAYAVGDRVGGVVFAGAYAELVLADPRLVSRVPPEVDAADALALVRGGLVALSALRAGRFEAGESVLVNAAASGVGHLAVQLASTLGAGRVVGAVGSADKAAFVRECGADDVVTYDQALTEPVDVVLDGVGGDQVQRGVAALAPHGRLVAFSAGGGSVDAGSLLGELKTVTGFSVGLLARTQPELLDRRRAQLWELLAAGRLRPRHVVYPLDQVRSAIDLIATRANSGRVVLRAG
ncbi:quinone oxidoreductase family protein [Labedaea rhizosphaerae]|uniref:NADPH:quinone reductase-like Zn-dependent oxidoreductase n=1 Tax=Labedaea rhizosphaerae TaxID=598644 RepID=A0A4R6SH68_LABRH|nr:zinc-binding dehydrogenase [Labedaea rhizosphaerae]TDQ00947.1 NADPH:quinone reductase-like Zn-dependent oxidoreductase [Labedaea rhizosphaerae]